MAKNISLLGANYPDVPAVVLPQTGGGTALFTDVSDTTANNTNVEYGKSFYKSNGNKDTGVLLTGIQVNCDVHPNNYHWVRPQEYPNLDVLYDTIGDLESCVYLTYDLRKTPDYGWIGIYAYGASKYYVERGHIENNVFVVDASTEMSEYGYFRQALDSTNGNIQLWRVRSNGNLARVGFCPNSATTAQNLRNNTQPCVERVGKLPYVTTFASNIGTGQNYVCNATSWLQRDKLLAGTESIITNLSGMYSNCQSLVETNCGEWDTSNWAVTSIASMFYYCWNLKELDLSGWDTSNWKITSMGSVFDICLGLKRLDVSTWDTSGWTPAHIEYLFDQCESLEELDLSHWDVSNWTITSIRSAWAGCATLKRLNLTGWDVSKWAITNMSSTWSGCKSLMKLDIANWDVSNWRVTSLSYAWSSMMSIRQLDLSSWDVSEWAVTSLESTWNSCRSLKTIPISGWDVSNWRVATCSGTWNSCDALESLDLSTWDVSEWTVTTMNSCFGYCSSLRELKIHNWDVSNWVVTDFSRVFYYCESLEEIDLTGWDVSGWAVTTVYYLFSYTRGVKKIDIHDWDVSNWALTEARYLYSGCYAESLLLPANMYGTTSNAKYTANLYGLIDYYGMTYDINQNYNNSARLTRASLLSIIDRLPTVTGSHTLTLGQLNSNKLTSVEIAVATQKGWTVA